MFIINLINMFLIIIIYNLYFCLIFNVKQKIVHLKIFISFLIKYIINNKY